MIMQPTQRSTMTDDIPESSPGHYSIKINATHCIGQQGRNLTHGFNENTHTHDASFSAWFNFVRNSIRPNPIRPDSHKPRWPKNIRFFCIPSARGCEVGGPAAAPYDSARALPLICAECSTTRKHETSAVESIDFCLLASSVLYGRQ